MITSFIRDDVKREEKLIHLLGKKEQMVATDAINILLTKISTSNYGFEIEKWYRQSEESQLFKSKLKELKELNETPLAAEVANRLTWCANNAPHFYNED